MEIAGVIERVERISQVRANPAATATTISSGLVAVPEIEAWCAAQHAGLVAQLRQVDSFPEKTIADAAKTSLALASKSTERSATLDATPALGAALGDGAITAGHIDALTRTSKRLDATKRGALFERADALAAVAAAATVDEFARRLELEAKRLDDVDGEERLERQRRAARARTWVDAEGMWNLSARLDPLTGLKVAARLEPGGLPLIVAQVDLGGDDSVVGAVIYVWLDEQFDGSGPIGWRSTVVLVGDVCARGGSAGRDICV